MIEKINKNLNRIVSTLKLLISHYEKKATPRIPLTEIRWSLSCALECVEKQIPKKPMFQFNLSDTVSRFECSCGKIIKVSHDIGIMDNNDAPNYCDNCGQKLDWSVEDM